MGFSLSDLAFQYTFEWTYGTLIVFLTIFLLLLGFFIHAIFQLIARYFDLKKISDEKDRRILSLELEKLALQKEIRKYRPKVVDKH